MTAGTCLSVIAGATLAGRAQSASTADQISELQKQNQALQQRLDGLEDLVKKEGLMPSGAPPSKLVSSLSQITISGFAQASYFYDVHHPSTGYDPGYLWNTRVNSFSLNKVKITLASPPAERSGEEWSAGFRVSLMAGEDAPELNSGNSITGFDWLREAYVDLNVPIGKGLNVKAGELISLLNFESGDGGAVNPNFSQGYQWWYTGNGPAAGVQLDYAFTDWLDVKARVDNGLYAGPVAVSTEKAVMGSVGLKPDSKSWVNFVGFGGAGAASLEVDGGSVLGGRQFTDKLGTAFEFDFFHFVPEAASNGNLWSIGGWAWYDFTPKVGLAARADFLDDMDGMGIKGVELGGISGTAITSPDPNGNLSSFTLTLNLRPTPNLKIQPEIRYNLTSYKGGFGGRKDQLIIGAGASYLF